MSGRWCGLAPPGGRVGNRQGKQGLPEPRPEVVAAPSAPAGRGAERWVHPGCILRVNPPSMADLQRKSQWTFAWSGVVISRWGKTGERGAQRWCERIRNSDCWCPLDAQLAVWSRQLDIKI